MIHIRPSFGAGVRWQSTFYGEYGYVYKWWDRKMDKENRLGRKTYLDSMKGIAILAVLATHTGLGHQNSILGKIGILSANGVQVFFIISAILSYSSLDKNAISDKKGWIQWFKSRILRIAPLYYIALLLSMIETGFNGNIYWSGGGGISFFNIASHLLFINGFHPFWINSIMSIEWYIADLMIFYALLPILRKYVKNINTALMFCCITSFIAIALNHLAGTLFAKGNEVLITFFYNFWFINQLQVFAQGILLYYIIPELKKKNLNHLGLLWVGLYFVLGILFNRNYSVISMHFILSIGICLIIASLSCKQMKLIDNPLFSTIGRYSYGMYLFHYMMMDYGYSKGWFVNGEAFYIWFIKYLCFCGLVFVVSFIFTNVNNYTFKRIKI